jgi:aromatic-amino-acid transaminase
MAPRDPILGLNEQFNADTNPNKVNLGVGVYFRRQRQTAPAAMRAGGRKNHDGKAHRPRLPAHRRHRRLRRRRQGLVFGADSEPVKRPRGHRAGIGGTGGLKIGADFLKKVSPGAKVLISDPSWENHRALFTSAGFEVDTYRYYDAAKRGVNFDGMLAA